MLDLGFCGLTVKIDQQPFPPIFQPQILSLDSCNIGDITYIKKQLASRIEKVRALDLLANNFTGSIPAEVGQGNIRNNSDQLQKLQWNQFDGPFPSVVHELENIMSTVWSEVIQTEDNHKPTNRWRSCTVSQLYVGVEVNMVAKGLYLQFDVVRTYNNGMDLSCNNLKGNIPSELGLLQGLYAFNLSHIPSET
ncbi:hypothetical protein V6N12_061915 [Hibiscus sabdariffa]|uniref:Uncharacterized protein n=1 Tax=Hibiscus sabdariffa TaxID=183260 RepID=A0ABR2DYG2_9ROSI